jgi:H+/Cl- antiporter ClcA
MQFLLVIPAMAQDNEDDLMKNTWNDIYLVVGAGAAGGILGLSTLSFVDKPSQHLSNIWTGAAIGIIIGVVVVAYNSAQKGSEELQSSADFNSTERLAWHHSNNTFLTSNKKQYGTEIWNMSF